MTHAKLFKKIAATNLPEALYQKMESHLDSLLSEYEQSEDEKNQIAFIEWNNEWKRNQETYREIKEEFNKLMQPAWLAFARERWPEIDSFFDIELSKKNGTPDNDNLDWI